MGQIKGFCGSGEFLVFSSEKEFLFGAGKPLFFDKCWFRFLSEASWETVSFAFICFIFLCYGLFFKKKKNLFYPYSFRKNTKKKNDLWGDFLVIVRWIT